ncbi:MAG: NUDIX domain-containing protein [Elusimicrobiota bacterium]
MKKIKLSKRKATLRSAWWQAQMSALRHCSFCGGKLSGKWVPNEKKKRLVCNQCMGITYTNPKVVAGVIPIMPDGKIVLLRRDIEPAKGKWTFPAGYQEMKETVEECAARETYEEICVKVSSLTLLGIYSYRDAGTVTIIYSAKVKKGEKPAAGQESQEVAVFACDQIPWKELAFRSTHHALKDFLK